MERHLPRGEWRILVPFKPNSSKQEKYAQGINENHTIALFWTDSNVFWEENFNCRVYILDQRKKTGHLVSSGKSWKHYFLQRSWWNVEELERRPFKRFPKITVTTSSLSNAEYIEVSFKNSYGRITLLQRYEGNRQTTFPIQYYIVLQEKISIYSRLKKPS